MHCSRLLSMFFVLCSADLLAPRLPASAHSCSRPLGGLLFFSLHQNKKKTLLRGLLFFSLPPNNPRNPLPKGWLASSCSGPLHSVQPQHSTSSSSNLEPLCYLTHFPGAYSCTMAVILQGDRGVITTVHNYLDQVVFSYFCIINI